MRFSVFGTGILRLHRFNNTTEDKLFWRDGLNSVDKCELEGRNSLVNCHLLQLLLLLVENPALCRRQSYVPRGMISKKARRFKVIFGVETAFSVLKSYLLSCQIGKLMAVVLV